VSCCAGRILNRFSRDVETMDSVLNQSLIQFSNCFAAYLAILVVISISTKWFGIAIIPLTVIYVIIQVRVFPQHGVRCDLCSVGSWAI
jgi:ABC-type transport system involved in cytochrome bd biosynthesis fused ATPase/permease subunit